MLGNNTKKNYFASGSFHPNALKAAFIFFIRSAFSNGHASERERLSVSACGPVFTRCGARTMPRSTTYTLVIPAPISTTTTGAMPVSRDDRIALKISISKKQKREGNVYCQGREKTYPPGPEQNRRTGHRSLRKQEIKNGGRFLRNSASFSFARKIWTGFKNCLSISETCKER